LPVLLGLLGENSLSHCMQAASLIAPSERAPLVRSLCKPPHGRDNRELDLVSRLVNKLDCLASLPHAVQQVCHNLG
jgi:hypothetical protein